MAADDLGGSLLRGRTILTIQREDGEAFPVAFYQGASDDSIRQTILDTLGYPEHWTLKLVDDADGCVVAINEHMPPGLVLRAVASPPAQAGNLPGSAQFSREGTEFRGELLKFERVNAHLANERTWLAWIRTALATLTVSFSLMSLSDSASNSSGWSVIVFIIGCLFIVCVLFTYVTGWLRYTKVKGVLSLAYSEIKPRFDRFGLSHQARYLGVLLVIIAVMYWFGAFEV